VPAGIAVRLDLRACPDEIRDDRRGLVRQVVGVSDRDECAQAGLANVTR